MYDVSVNDYNINSKSSTIYTPDNISRFLFDLLYTSNIKYVLDPAIGLGSLTNRFRAQGSYIIGVDIDRESRNYCDYFIWKEFEYLSSLPYQPDLIICNPPFNGAQGKKLYPEIFLENIVKLCGNKIPIVLFVPVGFRLNQRHKSYRWRWLRENIEITSIISLPLDAYKGVLFTSEISIFNRTDLKPHYFLPKEYENV